MCLFNLLGSPCIASATGSLDTDEDAASLDKSVTYDPVYCMATEDVTVLSSADEFDFSFDVIKAYEGFYVDGEVGEFYHVKSDWDYYVPKENILSGSELVGWLRNSEMYQLEVQVTAKTADLRKKGERGVYAEVEKGTLFRVVSIDKHNVLVNYEEENCYLGKSNVRFIYRVPEHTFCESYEALFTQVQELDNQLNRMLAEIDQEQAERQRVASSAGLTEARASIVKEALKYVGNPYVWGGTDPRTGADCSGFIKYVYSQFNYELPRVSYSQCNVGRKIESEQELQPGDLLFYYRAGKGRVGHVAMYIGNGKKVEAKGKKYGICITDFDWDSVYCARNVIGD